MFGIRLDQNHPRGSGGQVRRCTAADMQQNRVAHREPATASRARRSGAVTFHEVEANNASIS